ncbi:Signal recognition particle receptor subunit alpha-like protein [Zalerion maritima]|uniref:Signal recognition particle receptor subunit alpha homolog n=1 Tax=Zalerion maritima TaxID=339359 RepID=A0AAD5RWC2_9PEZI|nr:Signal recognition particle receptor subunit alpha-like protein [Zalerion maritima]
MLDTVEIITEGGVVLWSRKNGEASDFVINSFINDTFLRETVPSYSESAADNAPVSVGRHTLRFTHVRGFGLIFVAVYKSLLHLSWIDKFLDNITALFVSLYGDQVKKPNDTYVRCKGFDKMFDQQLRDMEAENKTMGNHEPRFTEAEYPPEDSTLSGNLGEPPLPGVNPPNKKLVGTEHTSTETSPIATPNTSRPSSSGGLLEPPMPAAVEKLSRRARKKLNQAASSEAVSSGDEAPLRKRKGATSKKQGKKGRRWENGIPIEDDGDDSSAKLDYSDNPSDAETKAHLNAALEGLDASQMGARNTDGRFALKELDDEDSVRNQANSILKEAKEKKAAKEAKEVESQAAATSGLLGAGMNYFGGMFKNVVGGKELTKDDLSKAMKSMEDHLLKKNVAREAAVRVCDAVKKDLVGTKTATFEGVNAKIRTSMEQVLRKMLTPTDSLDLLREIDAVAKPPTTSLRQRRPYVISIVGVNGVGKSTNLSKICFFLLQNKYRVLVVAGDTFRSGAVEQLAVHVRNLREEASRVGGQVDLYQKGYGKDAANVARAAVAHASAEAYDVVLIDTAGRRHNDQRLMSSLEKFAKFAQPDKILMVGEALVGTDSVAQARNFNVAFGKERGLDGFIISKCDTVGDMVGALVSIVHATGVPILFVGVGQHYSDIRSFSVKWAVEKLLSPPDA